MVCNHDHRTPSAEATAKVRPESAPKIVDAPPVSYESDRPLSAFTAFSAAATPSPGGSSNTAFARPLRV